MSNTVGFGDLLKALREVNQKTASSTKQASATGNPDQVGSIQATPAAGTGAQAAALGQQAAGVKGKKMQQAHDATQQTGQSLGVDAATIQQLVADKLMEQAGDQNQATSESKPDEMVNTSQQPASPDAVKMKGVYQESPKTANEEAAGRSGAYSLLQALYADMKKQAAASSDETTQKLASEHENLGRIMAHGFFTELSSLMGKR